MTDSNSPTLVIPKDKSKVTKHTLSYAYLDDLSHVSDSPWNYEFETKDDDMYDNIKKIIDTIFEKAEISEKLYKDEKYDELENMNIRFPSYWKELIVRYKNEIIDDLMDKGYWVWNRFEKYYVVAFALDFTRFEVYSKDCDKELIKWRENDKNDKIKGILKDSNYNENPVITLMKKING